ncbi:MAG TPA: penicillin-binding protein 2, partial [Rhizobiales bacterium]|nr:penicillin-binding protein 2 [Hyphomicrobiales bacterium]
MRLGLGRSRTADGSATARSGAIVVDAARLSTGGRTRNRVLITMALFLSVYGAIGGRLVYLG